MRDERKFGIIVKEICSIAPFSPLLPVRMFLKASSTLVESKAEVSIKERVFFSEDEDRVE